MSKVRVSNGSPPLDRVDARQADSARPPVCRNLFGSADREDLGRDVKEQMREMEEASKEKWNFDFAKDEPIAHGEYEWKEVDGKDLPEFYTRPHRVASNPVDLNGNHDYLLTNARGDCADTETGSALNTPRKRPSTEDHDPSCQSKRLQTTEANRCPDTTPGKSDPKT